MPYDKQPSRAARFAALFYDRTPDVMVRRHWWLAHAWYDVASRCSITVLWPFNYVVQWAYMLNYAWSRATHRNSWIDRRLLALGMDHEKHMAELLQCIHELDYHYSQGAVYPPPLRAKANHLLCKGAKIRSNLR